MITTPFVMNEGVQVETLLKEYPNMVERIDILKNIRKISIKIDDADIIEEKILGRPPTDQVYTSTGGISKRTETLALKMDELRGRYVYEEETAQKRVCAEIRILKLYKALYEIAETELTNDEKIIVHAHYQKGISLRKICDGNCRKG